MFNLLGKSFRCCDGISRRNVLKAGFLGLGGLTLPDLLRLRAEAAKQGRSMPDTSVIFVELAGGPTHIETYDPKPQAPQEYRGPLGVVPTNVSGVYFSELMKEQARIMDKLAVIRSIHHDSSSHGTSAHLTQTGYYLRDRQSRENDMPSAGSVTAKVRGSNHPEVPAYVAVGRRVRYGTAAHLGKGYNPFETGGDPSRSNFQVKNLSLNRALDGNRLDNRRALLAAIDQQREMLDLRGASDAIDDFTQQAFDLVTGQRAKEAFDIQAEPNKLRARYGKNRTGQSLLLARRLVEAGVTFVTVRVGGWDDHRGIEKRMKSKGPDYDRGIATLVEDLHQRGLNRNVMVLSMGEFGRTPKINGNAGRDHWGRLMSVLMAGGDLRTGQIVGSSNSKGEVPKDRPYRPEHVLATVYRHLGIDPSMTFTDHAGRPRYILEKRQVIEELV